VGVANIGQNAETDALAWHLFQDVVIGETALEGDEEKHCGCQCAVDDHRDPDYVAWPAYDEKAKEEECQGDFEADGAGDVKCLFCADKLWVGKKWWSVLVVGLWEACERSVLTAAYVSKVANVAGFDSTSANINQTVHSPMKTVCLKG
jgi:hypothetical protein